MTAYLAKITNKENVDKILAGQRFTHSDVYNFEFDIQENDSIFLVFSGDRSQITWEQGLAGYGRIIRAPYDKGYSSEKARYFKIDIEPLVVLPHPIPPKETKLHRYYQDQLFEVPYVGANHFPNQALARTDEAGALALFALLYEYDSGILDFAPAETLDLVGAVRESIQAKFPELFPGNLSKQVLVHEPIGSLIPKPFLILAGISGTGKTRWVREIAKRTGSGIGNLCLVPVRPDWHEPSDLMGYTSRITAPAHFVKTAFLDFLVKAWRDAWSHEASLQTTLAAIPKLTPHWLCLDEMNLAPVEQYFADYLSVVESRSWDKGRYGCAPLLAFDGRSEEELTAIRMTLFGTSPSDADQTLWQAFDDRESGRKPGIPLPPNLIVVGTVNMDETTHAFSRKVLDRAFTVEFDPEDIVASYRGGTSIDPVLGVHLPEGAEISASMVLPTCTSALDLESPIREPVEKLIRDWNGAMEQTPFRVAFRTLNEALLFVHSRAMGAEAGTSPDLALRAALDEILMMKLLPRLEGDVEKLGCDERPKTSAPDDPAFPQGLGNTLLKSVWDLAKPALGAHWSDSKSRRKLLYMAKRLARTGYTSFWP